MLIAGIQKMSLVDYPDKVACVVFTGWCNLRCRFCHNPALVRTDLLRCNPKIPEQAFFAFLEERKEFLDCIVISGGEPTIHHDLYDFCVRIKDDYWLLVKLDTNGSNPALVQRLIDEALIDYVAMDIKTDRSQWASLLQTSDDMTSYEQTISILLKGKVDYELRTTLIKSIHSLDTFDALLSMIRGVKQYTLQTYRPEVTLDSAFCGRTFSQDEMQQFANRARQFVQQVTVL